MTVAVRARLVVLVIALALAGCAPPAPSSQARSRPTTTEAPAWSTSTTRPPTARPTTGPGSRGLAATDRLQHQHRLAQVLPHSSPHYRIDFTFA